MGWLITIDTTGETAEWTADGDLVMSHVDQWEAWSAQANAIGGVEYLPTGPMIRLPPANETEAFAAVQVYLEATSPEYSTATVTGSPPDVSTLWLAPGEHEGDRVY